MNITTSKILFIIGLLFLTSSGVAYLGSLPENQRPELMNYIFRGLKGAFRLFGRLPGDFSYKKENVSFYAPIASSLILSVILSLFLAVFRKWF
jgi:hypothetical protein